MAMRLIGVTSAWPGPEVCRIRSTGFNSGRSQRFSTGSEQDQESVFLLGSGFGEEQKKYSVFLIFRCIFKVYINCCTGVKQEQESINFV